MRPCRVPGLDPQWKRRRLLAIFCRAQCVCVSVCLCVCVLHGTLRNAFEGRLALFSCVCRFLLRFASRLFFLWLSLVLRSPVQPSSLSPCFLPRCLLSFVPSVQILKLKVVVSNTVAHSDRLSKRKKKQCNLSGAAWCISDILFLAARRGAKRGLKKKTFAAHSLVDTHLHSQKPFFFLFVARPHSF